MTNIRQWIDNGTRSAERVPLLFPILIRQARLGTPITYGDAARELGWHWRATDRVAGLIGFTLAAIGRKRGWKRRAPPPLHSLIVNNGTHVPGGGIDGFMSAAYQSARTNREKQAVLAAVYARMKTYEHWDEVLELLDLQIDPPPMDALVDEATNARGRGGEGPQHEALKLHIAAHPEAIGLSASYAPGHPEFPLASGDRVDVVFEGRGVKVAVEVKSEISSKGDIARGLFQCLKYRTVLQKQSELSDDPYDVRVILAVGQAFPDSLISLRNSLDIEVRDNICPGEAG